MTPTTPDALKLGASCHRRPRLPAGFFAVSLLAALVAVVPVAADDWPMWRRDAGRRGNSPEVLPEQLQLEWLLELPVPRPAWPDTQNKVQFDRLYEPILIGKSLLVGSMVEDKLTAFHVETGEERWRFYTGGPVRLAPAGWKGYVYCASDDGYLYCLEADTGRLHWKMRGGPSDRVAIGNHRLVSMWPARGAPVVYDDKVYFGAGIWPFMGIFLYALDAETGEVIWENSGSGSQWLTQQHNSPAFAGVAPQGYIAATKDHLVVSGGRTMPAVYNRHTGEFIHYDVASRKMGSKGGGGYEVVCGDNFYLNRGVMYRIDNGSYLRKVDALVVTEEATIGRDNEGIVAYPTRWEEKVTKDRKGKETKSIVFDDFGKLRVGEKLSKVFIKSGNRLYAKGDGNKILAVDLPRAFGGARISWSYDLGDEPLNMISGAGRLFVTTSGGRIYCFGGTKPAETPKPAPPPELELIALGSKWRYQDHGLDLGTQWRQAAYDDSKWPEGEAQLGYGEKDEKTELKFGPDDKKKHVTAYFRHSFEAPKDATLEELKLEIIADDGAVIYLNGVEIGRQDMPDGEIKFDTLAVKKTDEKENVPVDVKLKESALADGKNVLAVEVHQGARNSSDLSFDLRLTATRDSGAPRFEEIDDAWTVAAGRLLRAAESVSGYALVLGLGTGRLAEELARQSSLHVVVLESDALKVESFRRRLDDLDIYGRRVTALVCDPKTILLPQYVAELVTSENAGTYVETAEGVQRIFERLRPYSGVFAAPLTSTEHTTLRSGVSTARLEHAELDRLAGHSFLRRLAPPTGSADWTHQNGDAANTVASADSVVRLPLGILWFGGPSNAAILPRHGHGPAPQIAKGRLFIEGRNMLRSVDIYTGRVLWERELKDIGKNYDYTSHEPGANLVGSNYVSLPDSVYAIHNNRCLRLAPETGETIAEFALDLDGSEGDFLDKLAALRWGYLGAWRDYLIAGAKPTDFANPDFRQKDFSGLKDDPLKKAVERVGQLKDFTPIARGKSGDKGKQQNLDRKYVLQNLNKLLLDDDMVAKIPLRARYKADVEGKEKELEKYLTEVAGRTAQDHRAVVLKRELLHKYFGTPKFAPKAAGKFGSLLNAGSKRLIGLDRFSGRRLWEHESKYEFRHNAIALGGGLVFAIDRMSKEHESYYRRRGQKPNAEASVVAIDIRTGDVVWRFTERVFGTWLGYSEEHDLLLQAGSKGRDRANDEVGKGMVALRGSTGEVIWQNDLEYFGPCVLLGDKLFTQGFDKPGFALEITTGKRIKRAHPVSQHPVDWAYERKYGCNTAIGAPNLLTFRSAAAGYYDLVGESGTGNWGGFRSGCTSNLIAAGGILNAPDYTRTCTCSYQNQASLALVHMPDVEMWTFGAHTHDGNTVERLGINFGAPGDRRSGDGVLWTDYPSVGGKSPDVPVHLKVEKPRYPRFHASRVSGDLDWVGASAMVGSGVIELSMVAPERLDIASLVDGAPKLVARNIEAAKDAAPLPRERAKNTSSLQKSTRSGKVDAHLQSSPVLALESATVEFWARADSDFDFVDARIDGKDAKHGFVIDNRKLRARYFVANEKGDGHEAVVTLEAKDAIADNKWVHVAWTYDAAAGVGILYRDGKEVARHDGPDGRKLWWTKKDPRYAILKDAEKRGSYLDELRISNTALAADALLLNADSEQQAPSTVGFWEMTPERPSKGFPSYTVRLHFAELEKRSAGERVFDVRVQDEHYLRGLDVVAQAGGAFRTLVREFTGVEVADRLKIELNAKSDEPPILSGVEVVRERSDEAGD